MISGHPRNHENRRQQHCENRSTYVAMIGALMQNQQYHQNYCFTAGLATENGAIYSSDGHGISSLCAY